MIVELRVYQSEMIKRAAGLMRGGHRSVLLQAPTGAGKTLTAAALLARVCSRGKRAWFVVHRSELIEQASAAFALQGIPHGYIAAGMATDKKPPIQVCMIQTLARRTAVEPPDLIVWDECHHCGAASYERLMARYPQAYHLGLTATPQRLDGRGLGRYFEHMVSGPNVAELIEQGFLSDYIAFQPPGPVLVGIKQRGGDYAQDELTSIMDKPRITGDAIQHYQKHAAGQRGLVFAVSIKHSVHIAEQFRAAGIPAEHVDGETPAADRKAAIARFRAGHTLVLCNVDLFGEGFDVPDAVAGLLLRPTQSLGLHRQQMGRLLRPKADGGKAVILDHAGNCRRHGYPDTDIEWTLDDREARKPKARDPEASARVCPACFAANKIGRTTCKYCGHPFPIKPREVMQTAGELVAVDREQTRHTLRLEQSKARTLEALREFGTKKGYRPGWADYVWKARQARRRG